MLFKRFGQFLKRAIVRNGSNGCSWHHSLSHECVGKLEDPMNQPALFRTKMPAVPRNVDQLPQFGFGIARGVFRRCLETEEPHRAGAGPVERAYGPLKYAI